MQDESMKRREEIGLKKASFDSFLSISFTIHFLFTSSFFWSHFHTLSFSFTSLLYSFAFFFHRRIFLKSNINTLSVILLFPILHPLEFTFSYLPSFSFSIFLLSLFPSTALDGLSIEMG